jgi:hypothetical protein
MFPAAAACAAMLMALVTGCMAADDIPPPLPVWLTLRWDGPQRETVPPLILYVSDEVLKAAEKDAGSSSPWTARITDAQLQSIRAWTEKHAKEPQPAAAFRLALGEQRQVAVTRLSRARAGELLALLLDELKLGEDAQRACRRFAIAHGLRRDEKPM